MSLDINGVWVRTKTLKRTDRWISRYKKILESAEQKCCTCASFYEMLLRKIRDSCYLSDIEFTVTVNKKTVK